MDFQQVKKYAKKIKWKGDKNQEDGYSHYLVAAGAVLKDGTKVFANNRTDIFENDIGACAERQIIAKVIDMGQKPRDILKFAIWAKDKGYEEINLSCCSECREAIQKYAPKSKIEMRYDNKIEIVLAKNLGLKRNFFFNIYKGADKIKNFKGKLSSHDSYLSLLELPATEQYQVLSLGLTKHNEEVTEAKNKIKK